MAEKEQLRSLLRRTIAETDIGKIIISCIPNELGSYIHIYNPVSSILGIYLIGKNMERFLLSIFNQNRKQERTARINVQFLAFRIIKKYFFAHHGCECMVLIFLIFKYLFSVLIQPRILMQISQIRIR